MALPPPENTIGSRFTELQQAGSTNNLAREQIEEGRARHGDVLFTRNQTAGRGQMGKSWLSAPNQNLAMTILLETAQLPDTRPFHLSVCSALSCQQVLTEISCGDNQIKWPNDLYWKSRKLGGLLIESSSSWQIVGIGINVNQTTFDTTLPNPVSLRQITGKELDPKTLAQRITNAMNEQIHAWRWDGFHPLLKQYRNQLFGKGASFTVRENGIEKVIRILDVEDEGALLIEEEGVQRSIVSGLEWIIRA